jgi:hypothetical protein
MALTRHFLSIANFELRSGLHVPKPKRHPTRQPANQEYEIRWIRSYVVNRESYTYSLE